MRHDRQSSQPPGQLAGEHQAGRTAIDEHSLLGLDLRKRRDSNRFLFPPLHVQPLSHGRLIQVLRRVRRLHTT